MEKVIPDFPEYKINTKGEVFSKYKPKTSKVWSSWTKLKPVLDKKVGYYLVTLVRADNGKRSNQFIHRLLAKAFIKNNDSINKIQVNHIDGNKQNNSLNNLEWVTPKENAQHAVKHGLTTFEYCEKNVVQCDKDTHIVIKEFKSQREAQDITGIARQNISKVCIGKRKQAGGYFWKFK